eukprot:CAMPEP_0185803362 /NCGR_PEP_ID=MMETSP1322-20130828/2592_1 /TAXON_ID=265543 /ORGANISM="Minutocellus polymorphus, Strain RCC2270" /LENGTH=41 /DNA_ID= /DNA_START= /DNA_END= /DNA_ORIENTATION=
MAEGEFCFISTTKMKAAGSLLYHRLRVKRQEKDWVTTYGSR